MLPTYIRKGVYWFLLVHSVHTNPPIRRMMQIPTVTSSSSFSPAAPRPRWRAGIVFPAVMTVKTTMLPTILCAPLLLLGLQSADGNRGHQDRHHTKAECGTVKHVHLSVGKEPATSMTVSFASVPCDDMGSSSSPSLSARGAIFLGTHPENLDRLVTETNSPLRYNATLPGRKHRPYMSDHFHHISLEKLSPRTKYYYRCAMVDVNEENEEQSSDGVHDGEEETESHLRRAEQQWKQVVSQSPVSSFITAPRPGEGLGTTRFAIMGDLAQSDNSIKTMKHLEKHREGISSILLVGDIAYSQCDHRKWDNWFDLMDGFPLVSELPLQIAPGNHDIDKTEPTGEIFVAYEKRFAMPQIRAAEMQPYLLTDRVNMEIVPYPMGYEYGNAYYSYIYGPSHHVVLCSYCSFEPGSKQYTWLVEELESLDRSITPWLFVMMHVPMYNTFRKHQKDVQLKKGREHLEPLFVKYRVNIVFSGHIHAYMRTKNIVFGGLDNDGPVHIIVGDGGRKAFAPFYREEPEEWVVVRDATIYGYGTLELINQTCAKWVWIHTGVEGDLNYVWNVNGTSLPPGGMDSFYLQNQLYN